MSSLRGERQPRSARHTISADARTDRDGHLRWRSGRALREPRARPGRRGARGTRARPDRTKLARALGQLLPGHSQLGRAASGPPVRRARPRRLHAPRRARGLPRELREGGRRAGTRGRRGQLRRTAGRRGLRSRHVGRKHRRLHRGPVHRRLPAAPPPGGRVHAPGRPAPDRRWATSSAPRASGAGSPPTSPRAWPSAISGTRSSWTASARPPPGWGLPELEIPDPEPIDLETPELVDLSGVGAVVFAGGFRPDYRSWVNCPGAFDELGFPIHAEGASTVAPGLYFVGVHFLRKRKSSLLIGVGEDAALVAAQIVEQRRA